MACLLWNCWRFWAAMGVAAIALRSRSMKFGLGFLVVSMAPICLISRRAGYLLYIPLMGWALYAGTLLQLLCGGLVRGLPLRFHTPVKFAVSMVAALAIIHTHAPNSPSIAPFYGITKTTIVSSSSA